VSYLTWYEAMNTVEKLSLADQLRLVTALLQKIQRSMTREQSVDLLTLAGVGAKVWAKVDTDAYLDQERDSWEA